MLHWCPSNVVVRGARRLTRRGVRPRRRLRRAGAQRARRGCVSGRIAPWAQTGCLGNGLRPCGAWPRVRGAEATPLTPWTGARCPRRRQSCGGRHQFVSWWGLAGGQAAIEVLADLDPRGSARVRHGAGGPPHGCGRWPPVDVLQCVCHVLTLSEGPTRPQVVAFRRKSAEFFATNVAQVADWPVVAYPRVAVRSGPFWRFRRPNDTREVTQM